MVRRPSPKRFPHPVVGVVDLDCEVLLGDGHGRAARRARRPLRGGGARGT
ncbi:hypothetical protein [Streptomyces sp. WMMB 714]